MTHLTSNYQKAAPAVFVFLWSTGFIGAKLSADYAEPFTFLALRFLIVAGILVLICVGLKVPIPRNKMDIFHIAVAGCLVHGFYLGGVFAAIYLGISAGISALIVGLQPLLTALLAQPLLGERLARRQWWGLWLGLAGVVLVVSRQISWDSQDIYGLGFCIISLLAITCGTIYQKRYCADMDLRSGSMLQFLASGLLMLLLAFAFETRNVEWHPQLVFALAWLCLVLSLGAITLLLWLIRGGVASRIASLFYLVPPLVALEAWLLFDEHLTSIALLGIALCALGVWLVLSKSGAQA